MGVGRYGLGVLDMGQSVIWIRYASTTSALNLLSSEDVMEGVVVVDVVIVIVISERNCGRSKRDTYL